MEKYFIFFWAIFFPALGVAQTKFFTHSGIIIFRSEMPLENIEAINKEVVGAIDIEKLEIAFVVNIIGFSFKNGLMQEHFNENYMESDKFPKAYFKGNLLGQIDNSKQGPQIINAEGDLTIHGINKKIKLISTLEIKDGKIYANASIEISPKDYNIKIPSLVRSKIANQVNINIYSILAPLQ